MKLKQNIPVPELKGTDIYGHSFYMRDLRGNKIFLTLYRTAACPFCNIRVHEVQKRSEEWKAKGVITIGIFASTQEALMKYAGAQQPNFTFLANSHFLLYDVFGIKKARVGMYKSVLRVGTLFTSMTMRFFTMKTLGDSPILPADFLINENGVVERAYYGEDFGDHLPLDEVDKWTK